MGKSIKKGIKDVKESKVIKVNNIDNIFKKLEEKKKKHPVYYFFHDIYWRVYHFIDDIPLRIGTFVQRGKRGWAMSDTWEFSYYLSKVISEGIYHLKENSYGCPVGLTEGKWIDILNSIKYTFDLAKRITDGDLHLIKDKKQRKKWQKNLNELNKKYKCYDRCMTEEEIKDYEKGWKLFKAHFFSLWD